MNIHTPNDKIRGAIKALSAARWSQERILEYLGPDVKSITTLTKYYSAELRQGRADMIVKAMGVMSHHLQKNELKAAEFILKSKIGGCGTSSSLSLDSDDGLKISIQQTYDDVITDNNKKNMDNNKDDEVKSSTNNPFKVMSADEVEEVLL